VSRPRKPTAVKKLAGERKDRMNANEPQPSGPASCPTNLSAGAQEVWKRLAPDLVAKGVLTAWDVDEFAAFCDAVDRRDRAAEHLDSQGEVIDQPVFDRNGKETGSRLVLSPWWQVWKGANEAMVRFGGRFGLSPADRAQLKVGGANGSRQGKDPARLLTS